MPGVDSAAVIQLGRPQGTPSTRGRTSAAQRDELTLPTLAGRHTRRADSRFWIHTHYA